MRRKPSAPGQMLPSEAELRAWAADPSANGTVPVHPNTLLALAEAMKVPNTLNTECEAELSRFDMLAAYDEDGIYAGVYSEDNNEFLFSVTIGIDARDLKAMLRYGARNLLHGQSMGRSTLAEQLRGLINAAPLEPV